MTLLIAMLYVAVGVGLTAIVFPNLEYLPRNYQKVLLFFLAAILLPPFFRLAYS